MSPKFTQESRDLDRQQNAAVPIQPHIISAAAIPYRLNRAIPPRPFQQQYAKSGSTTATVCTSAAGAGTAYPPYHQRLIAAALGAVEDNQSSNDSSSAPSSNAVSSGPGPSSTTSSGTTGQSSSSFKGKSKATSTSTSTSTGTVPSVPPGASPSTLSMPVPTSDSTDFDSNTSFFEQLMERNAATLPEPGLSYFERRRAIWTTSPPNPPEPSSPSPSRIKLEALLSQQGAVESEEVWRAGLKNVWKGLVGGNQLRKRLPLTIVLKILQAGWLRDGTWPEGMVAPPWEQHPIPTPLPPSPLPVDSTQAQQQRRVHEQEAYVAALHARANAEQASGAAQIMHMQAYALMGMSVIPPGYSPSSGDAPEEGCYVMPYEYADATPPPESERDCEMRQEEGGIKETGPPSTPIRPVQDLQSEMDTDDEIEEDDRMQADDGGRMKDATQADDGRHEGG